MCIIFGNFITILGVISMILTLFSLKKHSTAPMYAIFFCGAIITVLGVILLTRDKLIPKNSLPLIMGLLGIFLFILSVLQKSQVNTDWEDYKIDRKMKDSLLKFNFMVTILSLCLIAGSFVNFYYYSDENEVDDKVSYSFQKIKKLKKQQEEIKLKQDQLEYETRKELEKIKEETSGIIPKSPLIKNEHDQKIEVNSPKKLNFSQVLESPEYVRGNKIVSPSSRSQHDENISVQSPNESYSQSEYKIIASPETSPDKHSSGKSSHSNISELESKILNIKTESNYKSPKLETKRKYYDELDEIMAKLKADE